jgi:hypothetical protein
MKVIIGIDPGIKAGHIIVLSQCAQIVESHPIPTFNIEKAPTKKKLKDPTKKAAPRKQAQIDFKELFNVIESLFNKYPENEIYIEEISHLFGLPSSSNFRLGYACGVIHAALQTFGEFYLVPARKWQPAVWEESDKVITKKIVKKIEKSKTETKPTSLNAFKRIFPDYEEKVSEGIVDAALIAYYGLKS